MAPINKSRIVALGLAGSDAGAVMSTTTKFQRTAPRPSFVRSNRLHNDNNKPAHYRLPPHTGGGVAPLQKKSASLSPRPSRSVSVPHTRHAPPSTRTHTRTHKSQRACTHKRRGRHRSRVLMRPLLRAAYRSNSSPLLAAPPHLPLHHPLPPTSHRLCAYATDVAYLLAVSASAAAFGTNFFL